MASLTAQVPPIPTSQTCEVSDVPGDVHLLNDPLSIGQGLNRGGIETPFRWLPENVFDDGSWMLTDIDVDSWSVLNMST